MENIIEQVVHVQMLDQIWLSIFLVIPMVLISRTVVAGTRYSPILIVVIFGLAMGYIMVATGVAAPGLPEFPLIELLSRTTTIALTVTFFVGGQELRKIFGNIILDPDDMVVLSQEETIMGTHRTQLIFILRSFFLLIGIEAAYRALLGISVDALSPFYPLIAYIGLVGSIILIDHKATIKNKRLYIKKGLLEMVVVGLILMASYEIAMVIKPVIALPQIFFAMILSSGLGAIFYKWCFGPTIRALLFAGIPVLLAGNFMVGGSRMADAFSIKGMNSVLLYGFSGQLFWMFGGIALLMFFAKTTNARNLGPGMAGALSHSGLTGACTAGDLGSIAAMRAPIMINIPFFGHIFVFSILAISAERGELMLGPSLAIIGAGIILTLLSIRNLRRAQGKDAIEVKGLMQFAFGWQLVAMFGGFILLSLFHMPIEYAAMAKSSALSHFGLFAATQGGMFGAESAALIPFIFAMPFLVHPFVFFLFGRAMARDGEMPKIPVFILASVGLVGIVFSLFSI